MKRIRVKRDRTKSFINKYSFATLAQFPPSPNAIFPAISHSGQDARLILFSPPYDKDPVWSKGWGIFMGCSTNLGGFRELYYGFMGYFNLPRFNPPLQSYVNIFFSIAGIP